LAAGRSALPSLTPPGATSSYYSRFHKSQYLCAACHDVSNPALANLGAPAGSALPSELNSAHSYFHVERTFSEFMLSAYGSTPGGAAGIGPFTPGEFLTSSANNYISKCQDCHMRDVSGRAANKNDAILRPDGSIEHPQSGQPLHDLTGGNIWVSAVLASAVSGSPVYDAENFRLLNQGPGVLTLDLNQGMGVDPYALLAGVERAKEQLELAASISDLSYNADTGALSFKVQNQTGHKLISGFPEGRRMFVNIKAYNGLTLVKEINPYDYSYGTLKGMPGTTLLGHEIYADQLVYEMKPSSSITNEQSTFHFVLADGRYKDNRIPPKGFDISKASDRLSVPVYGGVESPGYFSTLEYAGGYDEIALTIPAGATRVEVNLYYQVTSREYIEFLRDQITGTGKKTLEDSQYIAQTDPFFAKLKAWGTTIWDLWFNNKDKPGAAPYLMASAATNGAAGDPVCTMPGVPGNLAATAGNKQVALSWSQGTGALTYNLYYDQAGKSQLIANVNGTSYTNSGLTNGQLYCYKVTSLNECGESGFSDVVCATPTTKRK
jgi:hypothetical protein